MEDWELALAGTRGQQAQGGIFQIFFERTALDECVSINIAENTRLRPWEAIGRETEKKRKEKKQLYSPGWIGTSTRGTTHIHPSASVPHMKTTAERNEPHLRPTYRTLAVIETPT